MSKIIVAAHQPNFMPNLGFFYKMSKADKFILITNIQYERQEGWQRRNRILNNNQDLWLTVPTLGSQNQMIKDVKINNSVLWQKKQKKTLELIYKKSTNQEFLNELNKIYETKWERLADLNIAIIKLIKNELKIPTELIIDEEINGDKQDLLINICKKYNADCYLSGNGAKKYMTQEYFSELEKNYLEHEFVGEDPTKEHLLSSVHYLLKEGKEFSNNILKEKLVENKYPHTSDFNKSNVSKTNENKIELVVK